MPSRQQQQQQGLFIRSVLTSPPEPRREYENTIESNKTYTSEYRHEFLPVTFNLHNDGTKQRIPSREELMRSIGDYTLLRTLGSGSTGKVKLAKHKSTNELVAIKIVSRKKFREAIARSNRNGETVAHKENRIIREALVVHLIDHPNIVKLQDLMITDDWFILIFEYIEGVQLLDFIMSHTKLSERMARKLFRQLLSAVDFLHRHSIVHRDLKIENIIISGADGCLKVLDFGLSNFYEPDQQLKTYCGSLYFAAPELLYGRPYVGPEIDIWSMGVTLYTMVVGGVPFQNDDINHLHALIKKGDFKCPDHLSLDLKKILKGMLCVDPRARMGVKELAESDWITNRGAEPNPHMHDAFRMPIDRVDLEVLDYLKLHARFQYDPQTIEEVLYGAVEDWQRYMNHPLISLYTLFLDNRANQRRKNEATELSFENISLEPPQPVQTAKERHRSHSLPQSKQENNTAVRKSSLQEIPYYPPISPMATSELLPLKQVYLKGIFSAHLSTARSPQDLKRRIVSALTDLNIEFEDHLTYISCKHHPSLSLEREEPVAFEIVMIRVMLLGAFGVQLKRISGSYVPYRKLCSLLLSKIR